MMNDEYECSICDYVMPYEPDKFKGVLICANCKEEYRRGLLTDWHFGALKNGTWIPQGKVRKDGSRWQRSETSKKLIESIDKQFQNIYNTIEGLDE